MPSKRILCFALLTICLSSFAQPAVKDSVIKKEYSGNPLFQGWYADPEARIFNHECWVYPTYSDAYDKQVYMDAFSSPDLVNWTKHTRVLDTMNVKWARRAVWAPSVVEKNGKYFLFFGANDIQNNQQAGGIGIASSDSPGGPF